MKKAGWGIENNCSTGLILVILPETDLMKNKETKPGTPGTSKPVPSDDPHFSQQDDPTSAQDDPELPDEEALIPFKSDVSAKESGQGPYRPGADQSYYECHQIFTERGRGDHLFHIYERKPENNSTGFRDRDSP